MFRRKSQRVLTADDVRQVVYNEMKHFLEDVEFRVKQAYDVASGGLRSSVYAEDMNLTRHMITGYTVTANTGAAGATLTGSIAWASVHVVYNGTDYAMVDGSTGTTNKYVWFDPTVSTTVLQQSPTKPDLSTKPSAALLFVNNAGTPYDVLASSIPAVLANGTVDAGSIQPGAVTAPKINTIQHLLY